MLGFVACDSLVCKVRALLHACGSFAGGVVGVGGVVVVGDGVV